MTHSVNEFYLKAKLLLEKVELLHRARYESNHYDKSTCQHMMDDVKSLARDIEHGLFDIDKE